MQKLDIEMKDVALEESQTATLENSSNPAWSKPIFESFPLNEALSGGAATFDATLLSTS